MNLKSAEEKKDNYFFNVFLLTLLFNIFCRLSYTLTVILNTESLPISWPESVTLPAIKALRGELIYDFFSQSVIRTPIVNLAQILNQILPENNLDLITSYHILNQLAKSITESISILIISIPVFFIISKQFKFDAIYQNKIKIFIFLLTYIFFYSPITINFLIRGVAIAGINYPSAYGLYPHGVSVLLSFLSIMIVLIIKLNWLKSNKIFVNKFLIILNYSFFIGATYIHPVVPFSVVIISSISNLLKVKDSNFSIISIIKSISYVHLIIWFFCVALFYFNNDAHIINNIELFNIYVKERHPHHFLTSYYLSLSSKAILYNFILLILILFIEQKNKYKPNLIKRIIIIYFILFFTITSLQYFGVEILKLKSIMYLGPSRMYFINNYLYFIVISTVLIKSILIRRNFFNKSLNKLFLLIKKFNSRKLLIISYTLLSLFIILNITYSFKIYNLALVNSIPYKLSEIIKKTQFQLPEKSEILFSDELYNSFIYSREIGNLNIFSDNYYPNESKSSLKWYVRKKISKQFNKCVKSNKDLDLCIKDLENFNLKENNKLYYLSDIRVGNKNEIMSFKINNRNLLIYEIN